MVRHLSVQVSMKGTLGEGNPKDGVFEICKMSCRWVSLSIGALEGVRLPGLLREKKVYTGSFLGPGGIGAIWNFVKGTWLLSVDILSVR